MANCLRAARAHGVRVVVCDRPNPINGDDIEGATLDPAYASFVGQFPIPMRHGLTIGEAARLFNDHFGLNAAVDVVPMDGWTRSMYFDETGLPVGAAVAQHPDARHRDRLPGRRAVRGHAAVGRARDDAAVRDHRRAVDRRRSVRRRDEPPEACRACTSGRSSSSRRSTSTRRQPCGGCQVHVTDRSAYRSMRVAVEMLEEFRKEAPGADALARSAVRVRDGEAADRHPVRIRSAAARHRRRRARRVDRRGLAARTKRPSASSGRNTCSTDDYRASDLRTPDYCSSPRALRATRI